MDILGLWQSWLWFAGAALGLATMLAAVVYALSELLQNDKMKGWAKMELTEIVYSAIIISMALVTLPLIDAVVQGGLGVSNAGGTGGGTPGCLGSTTSAFIKVADYGAFTVSATPPQCLDICGEPIAFHNQSVYHGVESCHLRLGIWYLREVFDEAKAFAFDIYLSYIKTSMLAEFTINIEFLFEKAGFFTFTPWKGFFTMGNRIKEMCFDWAIKIMMLTRFQEVMLRFIATALFPALFVSGALLRTFTFTRKLGGLLLAMAIALYFIFPSFYAFGALIMLDLKNDPAIQYAWIHNTDANPEGANNPNPPIANTMYIRGDIPMPGGGQTNYSTDEVRARLRAYEGMDSATYFDYMEQGRSASGEALTPLTDPSTGRMTDLSSRQHSSATAAEVNASLARSKQEVDTWYGSVSKQNMLDKFIGFAWMPNGPIDTLARLTFWSVFFALFSIIGTIAAIRSLSSTFGGDIEIAGLTRLI
ncbi:hypothetical protein L0Y65_06455 [Candidatus Micrarchaeota archaeon]|nr:hypothetical protein [Candidatus Micrarchaeota archaeon]